MAEGIETRHRAACRSRQGKRCNCMPSHRGIVVTRAGGTKERFRSEWTTDPAVAAQWRRDALNALAAGVRPSAAGPHTTVAAAIGAVLEGMRDGRVLTRSGKRYKPSTIRSYTESAEVHVKPALGTRRLTSIRRGDVQGSWTTCARRGSRPRRCITSSTCCA
jgi:hypothetical protein